MPVDFSACVEATAGYYSYYETEQGHIVVEADSTGNATERIYGKDPTAVTADSIFYLEKLSLSCGSGRVALLDGSSALTRSVYVLGDNSMPQSYWGDYHKDPIRCLAADNTHSLSILATNGFWNCMIKGYWG